MGIFIDEEQKQNSLNSLKAGLRDMYESGDFGAALIWLGAGCHVARRGWHGRDMCIFLIKGRTVEYNMFQSWKNAANTAFDPPQDIVIQDHIDMKAADGTYVTGWSPSQEDMLSNDWFMVR